MAKVGFSFVTKQLLVDYTYDSFSQCIFNPLAKDLLKTYPSLKGIEADNGLTDKQWERVLRYIILAYDHNSPLIKTNSTLQARKYQAATLAGFDVVKDKIFLDEIFDCKNEAVVSAICHYLKFFGNSMIWAMIVSQTELFWEYCRNIATPVKEGSDKDIVAAVNGKSKMSEDIMKIKERIDALTREFYGDEILQDVHKKVRMTPESMAKLKV